MKVLYSSTINSSMLSSYFKQPFSHSSKNDEYLDKLYYSSEKYEGEDFIQLLL